MKVIVVKNKKKRKPNKEIEYRLNSFLEWLIYMLGYALVLLITSNLFRSLYVENFLYGFIAAVIIYILNKTVKPILVTISLPLIGLSLGLFYFVINVIILLLVFFYSLLSPRFILFCICIKIVSKNSKTISSSIGLIDCLPSTNS